MKSFIINLLQSIFGFERYLFIFSIFIINKLKWDKNERDFLKLFDLIHDDGIVLDIGANIGVMTTYFSRKLKMSEVYAFEPIPHNIRTLEKIIDFFRLSNVKVFKYALGNYDGNAKMIMPIIDRAKKQGLSHIKNDVKHDEQGEEFEVEVKQLDNIEEIKNLTKRITAIKIDVEGFELNVLKGATETIKKHKPVVYCELWDNVQRIETIQFLRLLNYSPKIIIKNELLDYSDQPNQNFFFIFNGNKD